MTASFDALVTRASEPLGTSSDLSGLPEGGPRFDELWELLRLRNGFFAFESALRVFPAGPSTSTMPAEQWNALGTWKYEYSGMADGLWCFAEDIFGVQFAIHGDDVVSFDPETGDVRPVADSIGSWAHLVLMEYKTWTGWVIAHNWQTENGALSTSQRLLPKLPFVLGGSYDLTNLYAGDAVEGMRWRGSLATQIRDLPDGATIEFVVRD